MLVGCRSNISIEYERILVRFLRIVGNETSPCCIGILCDNVRFEDSWRRVLLKENLVWLEFYYAAFVLYLNKVKKDVT